MEDDDLELDSEGDTIAGSSSHPVRKQIAIKLKPSPKSRGRPKKPVRKERPMDQDFDDDLVPDVPLFKSMESSEPMHREQRLRWDHRVNLLGEKVVDPIIHCCEKCALPILIYGRMIPCKHVFCLDCAKKTEKSCARCEEPVQRVEQSALGTVFVCTYGGTKLGVSGCRRTYLSQRDLQAHVDHRHLKRGLGPEQGKLPPSIIPPPPLQEYVTATRRPLPTMDMHHRQLPPPQSMPDPALYQRPSLDQRLGVVMPPTNIPPPQVQPRPMIPQPLPQTHVPPPQHLVPQGMPPPHHPQQHMQQQPPPVSSHDNYVQSTIPVMTSNRGNLISVPIQDERPEYRGDYRTDPPPNYVGHMTSGPPPVSFPPTHPPPTHHPPPAGHYPPSTMTPPPHQGPPRQPPPVSFAGPPPMTHGPPPNYSTPNISKPGLPPPGSHPPPIHSVPPPHLQPPRPGGPPNPMTSPPPIAHLPMPGGPPPRMGPPGSQPHMGGPPPRYSSPHPHYEETAATPPYSTPGGQSPRMPWSGPPARHPPPHTPVSSAPPNMAPPPQRPSDSGPYKYY